MWVAYSITVNKFPLNVTQRTFKDVRKNTCVGKYYYCVTEVVVNSLKSNIMNTLASVTFYCELCWSIFSYKKSLGNTPVLLESFFFFFLYRYHSVSMPLSPNHIACELTFRTNSMYFSSPGARIDNWIMGSIISTQWSSLIRGAQPERGGWEGKLCFKKKNCCGLLNKRAIKQRPLALEKRKAYTNTQR